MSQSRTTFFRQSGWMMVATVASGAFMFGVHFFSKKIPESEYGILVTLLAMLNCMAIPALGLQMVFAQQTAAAITDHQKHQLTGTAQALLFWTFLMWVAMAAVVLVWHRPILERLQISNPAALWVTVCLGLTSLWSPIFGGMVQGQQNFLWFGWGAILSGIGRFASVAMIVLICHGFAAGIMTGALLGMMLSVGLFAWQSRSVWIGPKAPIEWGPWFRRVVPLTLGFASFQFMFSADPIFVQSYFDKEKTSFYGAAGTLSRALVLFTVPVAQVMFPKIVRAMAQSEKTNVMALSLATTAALAGAGALGLSMIAPWILKLVFKSSFLEAVPLLPWFAWSMVPLALANVLVNNLLARERFGAVPWLLLVAMAYGLALTQFHASFTMVIQTLGLFNLALLGVAARFTWRAKS
jgi:O-antigen/teichoic acid export membrane protein